MAFTQNRLYNDPNLGAAFTNLAQAFGPPSAQDVAAYSVAGLNKQKNDQLAQLFAGGTTPSEQASLIGVQDYGQTPQGFTYQVDTTDATDRYGIGVEADTARRGQDVSAQASVVNGAFGPLNPGQIRPALPEGIAGQFGLPALPPEQGAPKPLSMDEAQGLDYLQLPQDQREAIVFGSTPIEAILGADGAPTNVLRPDAIGQTPYNNSGSQAAKKQVILRDPNTGRSARGVFDPNTGLSTLEDGSPAPANMMPYDVPSTVGTPDQTGLGKPVQNNIEQQLIDITVAKNTAVRLRDLIISAPASQGAVGWLRGTTQNVLQTGGELGAFFGGGMQEVMADIERGAADSSLAGAFDPNIPAIEMMANLLAFQYAKTTTGERLSNEMLRASRAALGLDSLTGNQADSAARLETAISLIEDQEGILRGVMANGLGPGTPAPGAPPAAPMAPAAPGGLGGMLQNLPGAAPPPATPRRVNSPEEAMQLPSGTPILLPDGTTGVVP
jgi:hypothetical protein